MRLSFHYKLFQFKTNFFTNCVNNFPGYLCIKSQRDSFLYKGFVHISQLLHDKTLDEYFISNQIEFDFQIKSDSSM